MTKSNEQLAVIVGVITLGVLYWKYKDKMRVMSPPLGTAIGTHHAGVQSTEWFDPHQYESCNPGLYFASY